MGSAAAVGRCRCRQPLRRRGVSMVSYRLITRVDIASVVVVMEASVPRNLHLIIHEKLVSTLLSDELVAMMMLISGGFLPPHIILQTLQVE